MKRYNAGQKRLRDARRKVEDAQTELKVFRIKLLVPVALTLGFWLAAVLFFWLDPTTRGFGGVGIIAITFSIVTLLWSISRIVDSPARLHPSHPARKLLAARRCLEDVSDEVADIVV